MTSTTELSERAMQVFSELAGEKAASVLADRISSGQAGSALSAITADLAFGQIWGRPGLDLRSRSLVTLGILMHAHAWTELKNHMRIAIRNGITPEELQEVVIQALPYSGSPVTVPAMSTLVEVLRELGLDTKSKTHQELGLL